MLQSISSESYWTTIQKIRWPWNPQKQGRERSVRRSQRVCSTNLYTATARLLRPKTQSSTGKAMLANAAIILWMLTQRTKRLKPSKFHMVIYHLLIRVEKSEPLRPTSSTRFSNFPYVRTALIIHSGWYSYFVAVSNSKVEPTTMGGAIQPEITPRQELGQFQFSCSLWSASWLQNSLQWDKERVCTLIWQDMTSSNFCYLQRLFSEEGGRTQAQQAWWIFEATEAAWWKVSRFRLRNCLTLVRGGGLVLANTAPGNLFLLG